MECERKVLLYIDNEESVTRTVCHYLRNIQEPNDKVTFVSLVDNEKMMTRLYNLFSDKGEKKLAKRVNKVKEMLACAEEKMRSMVGDKLCYVESEKEVLLTGGENSVEKILRYSREKKVEMVVYGNQQFNMNNLYFDEPLAQVEKGARPSWQSVF